MRISIYWRKNLRYSIRLISMNMINRSFWIVIRQSCLLINMATI